MRISEAGTENYGSKFLAVPRVSVTTILVLSLLICFSVIFAGHFTTAGRSHPPIGLLHANYLASLQVKKTSNETTQIRRPQGGSTSRSAGGILNLCDFGGDGEKSYRRSVGTQKNPLAFFLSQAAEFFKKDGERC